MMNPNPNEKTVATVPGAVIAPEPEFTLSCDFLLTRETGVLLTAQALPAAHQFHVLFGHRNPEQCAHRVASFGFN